MEGNQYFLINDIKHKVIGIKGNRVIFQNMESGYYPTNPSYQIHYKTDVGYYINVPTGFGYNTINLKDILKSWNLYQEMCLYYKNKK